MQIRKLAPLKKKTETLTVLGRLGPAGKSSGLKDKPEGCGQCKFVNTGIGFLDTHTGQDSDVCLLFSWPHEDELLYQRPYAGRAWFRKKHTEDRLRGLNISVAYITRCMPPRWSLLPGKNHPLQSTAAASCARIHGNPLSLFRPDIILVTYDPFDIMRTGAYMRQIHKDVEKARFFREKGYRTLIALGDKAVQTVAPFVFGAGGLPAWHGHWFEYAP